MADPITFLETQSDIGLTVRRRTEGREWQIVRAFADWAACRYECRSERVAFFFEPAVETRFPDIVVTVYDPRRFEAWPAARRDLEVPDLKLLHHLHLVSATDLATASRQLGVKPNQLACRFEHLHAAGLARRKGASWHPVALSRTFGIKRLIAVEAKIGGWQAVFEQASANRWFASEACVLTAAALPNTWVLERYEELGIGIFTSGQGAVTQIKEAARMPLPSSYASWLFNEWIGRSLGRPPHLPAGD